MKYTRTCSHCGSTVEYTVEANRDKAALAKKRCRSCCQTKKDRRKPCTICGKLHTGVGSTCGNDCRTKQISQTKLQVYGSAGYNNRMKASETCMGKYGVSNPAMTESVKSKVSSKGRYYSRVSVAGQNNPMYGRKHSEETKNKQRIRRCESLAMKGNFFPGFNPIACAAIDQYGLEHGYNFQHALNGGEFCIKELGYWVDGYDSIHNVVIEFDEPHHYTKSGQLKQRDIIRQQRIEEVLKCKFIRIKQKL